jgi:hypothetical protein
MPESYADLPVSGKGEPGVSHEVWFAIPTVSPEMCRRTLPLWKAHGYRIALLQDAVRFEPPEADAVVHVDEYRGWAWAVNLLATRVVPSTASLVVTGGDDMRPDPTHSADELAEQFLRRFPDGFGVMQPHGDAYLAAKHYCGSPFFGRAWIDQMYAGQGPVFEGYYHNWCDNEIYWLARCLGALWCRPDLTHHHEHYTREGRPQGPARRRIDARDRDDCRLFLARAWTGFPGHEPLGPARPFDPAALRDDPIRLAEAHYVNHHARALVSEARAERFRAALVDLASRGRTRVAIYGAGKHTRALANALASPPLEICCIIDDDPSLYGTNLWGFPIVSRHHAIARGPDAVVISSDSVEPLLWERAACFRDAGIEVVRLYRAGPAPLTTPALARDAA